MCRRASVASSLNQPAVSLKLSQWVQVGSVGAIQVGGRGQTARIWALEFKFAPNKAFTFDVRYDVDDDTEISTVREGP